MKTLKNIMVMLALLPALASCTKVIDLKLGNDTGKIVIEGNVTNTAGPQVIKLSRNVQVSTPNTYPPVTGATVNVSDNEGHNFIFTESTPGTYTNNALTGTAGNTYTMSVLTGTTTYQATSVMPTAVPLDSLTYKEDEINTSKHKKVLTVHYQDPAGVVNQYRFIIWVNQVQVKTIYAFNDDFTEGRYVSFDLRVRDNDDSDFGVYAGDTVTVEMQCIDKPVYTYWYTLMQQSPNGPGGGVTPADPPTNIKPTALGYFSAHSTQSETIVIK
ncbi:protein of unknown function [Mucilaginibacter pineti]|uniref:DUF4249 domain-containing protein n=1 Tax=Mucilaginibacter pineti TaxID=1391627 RepID=A0A1G6ZR60_9SPHI|nr:DUF4249 domain-containing protein [Mucilaginibacter pineti]SDE05019.1 protein of unknown function [Mucilaginibacter pineti]